MNKNKYGIFDNVQRKIVGILSIDNDSFNVEINGETANLQDLLSPYDGCDIIISVNNKSEEIN